MQRFSKFFFLFTFLFSISLYSEIPVPELKSRVMDLSGVLSNQEKAFLENKLENLEDKKGSQVVILILPTIDGEPIEQFSLRVVEKWELGRKKINDGVLILVVRDDRKMRIEVGYGLEGVLPDAICKRIISEQMRPNFKDKKFYEGLDIAVESIRKSIDGEPLPPPVKSKKVSHSNDFSTGEILIIFIIIIIFGSSLTSNFASTSAGYSIGAGIFATIGSVIIMGLLSGGSSSILIILLAGIISFILFGIIIYWWSQGRSSYSSGGYWSSSSSGSSWSSSSDSFGGGGGDFGGGGASGDW